MAHIVCMFEGDRDAANLVEAISAEESFRANPAGLGGAAVSREVELFAFVKLQLVDVPDGDVDDEVRFRGLEGDLSGGGKGWGEAWEPFVEHQCRSLSGFAVRPRSLVCRG